jgi:hypothetical protein
VPPSSDQVVVRLLCVCSPEHNALVHGYLGIVVTAIVLLLGLHTECSGSLALLQRLRPALKRAPFRLVTLVFVNSDGCFDSTTRMANCILTRNQISLSQDLSNEPWVLGSRAVRALPREARAPLACSLWMYSLTSAHMCSGFSLRYLYALKLIKKFASEGACSLRSFCAVLVLFQK